MDAIDKWAQYLYLDVQGILVFEYVCEYILCWFGIMAICMTILTADTMGRQSNFFL